jgi:hypothetical protein
VLPHFAIAILEEMFCWNALRDASWMRPLDFWTTILFPSPFCFGLEAADFMAVFYRNEQ